jgi:alcohol dehydrogenase
MLEDLSRRFGKRVRPVRLTGVEHDDCERIRQAAGGPIDCVLDILPPAASATVTRTAIMSVRPHGRAVLMGGVGMLGGEDLTLPYPWIMRNWVTVRGQWMYPPEAATKMVNLIRAGLLDLDQFAVTTFDMTDANDAVAHAAANSGAFKMTVIRPQ